MSAADADSSAGPSGSAHVNGAASTAPQANGHAEAVEADSKRATGDDAAMATAIFDPTRAPESGLQHVPRDARLMALILQSMGIQDVQPPALMMLLEFAHRYVYETLQDAIVYADHAGTGRTAVGGISTLSLDDIQLAIQGRVNHSFTGPPNKDMLLSLASSLNSVPLPPISDKYGVKLPPAQHCLTNVNFSIIPNSPPREDELYDEEEAAAAEAEERRKDEAAKEQARTDVEQLIKDARGNEDEADETAPGDTTMASATDGSAKAPEPVAQAASADSEQQQQEQRGTKRALDEDDDYD